jgi:hypothetical protein
MAASKPKGLPLSFSRAALNLWRFSDLKILKLGRVLELFSDQQNRTINHPSKKHEKTLPTLP